MEDQKFGEESVETKPPQSVKSALEKIETGVRELRQAWEEFQEGIKEINAAGRV